MDEKRISHVEIHPSQCCKQSDFVLPRDWTTKQKWMNVVLISWQAIFTSVTSTMLAAGTEAITTDYNLTDSFSPRLPIALYILAMGIGPMFLGPLSEIYGRRKIYICAFFSFTLCNMACGFAPNISSLAAFRFLGGLAGSASATLSGATVGDMFVPAQRAKAQAIYSAAPLLGPVIGGICGGYVVSGTGNWRWTMWIMTIIPGISAISCFFFLKETYAPYLKRVHGIVDFNDSALNKKPNFQNTILRPLRLLFFSPTVMIMALYVGAGYGIYYFHIVTVPLIFGNAPKGGLFSYQWNSQNTGLAYLGLGTGSIFGVFAAAKFMNPCYNYVFRKMKGQEKESKVIANVTADLEDRVAELEALIRSKPWNWKQENECGELGCDCCSEDQLPEYEEEIVEEEEEEEEEEDCPEARLPFMGVAMIISPVGLIIFAWTVGVTHWIVPLIGAGIFSFGTMMAYVSIQNYLVDVFGNYAASALAATALLRAPIACGLSVVSFEAYEALNYNWGTMILAFVLVAMLPGLVFLFIYGKKIRMMGRND